MLNVSIIIPAWNEAERIRDCLLNATRQTIMPHEVLVVDNRSTDNTCAVVEQFIAEHPEAPVKLLHQNDEQGLIPTRNFGLNAATGEYTDLMAAGISDPVKVTRSALQNAASIAGMFLTTEAVVADKPEAPAAGGDDAGAGMGGMY